LQSLTAKYLIGHHLEILQFFFKNYPKYLGFIENASIFAAPFLIRINLTFVFGLGL